MVIGLAACIDWYRLMNIKDFDHLKNVDTGYI